MTKKATEKHLLDALDRLSSGHPTHNDLINRAFKLNPTNLAKESGISRNTIYTSHRSILPKLRAASETQQGSKPAPLSATDKIAELRSIIRQQVAHFKKRSHEFEEEIQKLATENADLLARTIEAEHDLNQARRQLSSLQSRDRRDP